MDVRLRRIAEQDSSRALAWRNSPEVAAFMYGDHWITQPEHDRWFSSVLQAEDRRYWIIERDGAPVGLANVVKIDTSNRRCDWAYYLADPTTRGQGVGSCVEYLVIQHVFGPLGLNKLWCEVFDDNEAVWKLHERFGFVREALYRDHVIKGGRFRDVIGLGLLARDWAAARPACEARLRDKGFVLEALRVD